MKLISLPIVLTMLVLGCTKHEVNTPIPVASHRVETHTATDKKEVWTCPMHPQIKADKPGACPICGMTLVKAENMAASEGENMPESHVPIKLQFDREQLIGVKTSIVHKIPLFKT